MKYTNKLNLPQSIVNCCKENDELKENRYSITELLKPTQEILLTRKYYKDIEVDVSDCINVLFGSAVHKLLEDNDNENVEKEVKMELDFNGYIIVGKFDRRDLKNQLIEDYKTGTVSKVTKGDFEDYRKQGLAYAWMTFKLTNILIRKLKFYILLKDYSKLKSTISTNYPSNAIYIWEYDIKDSDYEYIEKYIKDKLDSLKNDNNACTDEERWFTGNKYAVYKKVGDKRAFKTFDNEEDAHKCISEELNGTGEIEIRKGEYIKCKFYCNCSKFCNQWRNENKC